jgi:hypothetical protein
VCLAVSVAKDERVLLTVGEVDLPAALLVFSSVATSQPASHHLNKLGGADGSRLAASATRVMVNYVPSVTRLSNDYARPEIQQIRNPTNTTSKVKLCISRSVRASLG